MGGDDADGWIRYCRKSDRPVEKEEKTEKNSNGGRWMDLSSIKGKIIVEQKKNMRGRCGRLETTTVHVNYVASQSGRWMDLS